MPAAFAKSSTWPPSCRTRSTCPSASRISTCPTPIKEAAVAAIRRGFNTLHANPGHTARLRQLAAGLTADAGLARSGRCSSPSAIRRPAAGLWPAQPRRRSALRRPVLRHVQAPGQPGRRRAGRRRYLPRFPLDPDKFEAAHDFAANQTDHGEQSPANPTGAVADADNWPACADWPTSTAC